MRFGERILNVDDPFDTDDRIPADRVEEFSVYCSSGGFRIF